jgi:hypothetical protein
MINTKPVILGGKVKLSVNLEATFSFEVSISRRKKLLIVILKSSQAHFLVIYLSYYVI